MNARVAASITFVLILVAVVLPDAQRRGGAPPGGPGGPGRGARPTTGIVERITIHGKSLEGNLEGDSPDREVTVYLPPSYAADQNRRFPVVYLLHGFGERDTMFTGESLRLQQSADRLAAAQGFSEQIVVMPNAFTLHKGSMYSNSVTTGDWERFIADDLVGYIDSHYRTLAHRMSRGLAGHSMGGYGALRIGMKRPDVFASMYAMSACCLTANRGRPDATDRSRDPQPEWTAAAEAIKTRAQAEDAARAPGFGASVVLGWAAAWSPNPKNPPLFLDLPVTNGKDRPDVIAKWVANAPLEMVGQYAANLNAYYAIAMDVGTADGLLESKRQLHAAMTKLRIPHAYEEYDGDHTNRVRERIESSLLPFFARNLASPVNLTPPSPAADRLSTPGR